MERPPWAPDEVDLEHPSVARVYDYYLGGSHNFESDRAFARKILQAAPAVTALYRDNRAFLGRAVRYLCREGVDQFLDLGSGIPTAGNVHEVARAASPAARVVYVDHDPVAVVHSNHILAGDDRATAVLADVRDADGVLDLARRAGLDLGRPVAVLAVAVLHFVDDADDPVGLMARYMAALRSGHLAISHASRTVASALDPVAQVYDSAESPTALFLRTPEEITALFGGLDLVAPGVVQLPRWRPEASDDDAEVPDDYPIHAGIGRR